MLINEVVVTATAGGESMQQSESRVDQSKMAADRQELIEECVEEVLSIIERREQR